MLIASVIITLMVVAASLFLDWEQKERDVVSVYKILLRNDKALQINENTVLNMDIQNYISDREGIFTFAKYTLSVVKDGEVVETKQYSTHPFQLSEERVRFSKAKHKAIRSRLREEYEALATEKAEKEQLNKAQEQYVQQEIL